LGEKVCAGLAERFSWLAGAGQELAAHLLRLGRIFRHQSPTKTYQVTVREVPGAIKQPERSGYCGFTALT
jgi:hypothetical protein